MRALTCELVPRTCWWSNVRSHVTRSQWEICKTYARAKTAGTCWICDQIPKGPLEAHEIWRYNDDRGIQTLVDIVPLCKTCHQVKHLGRTRVVSNPWQWERVITHLAAVNNWSDRQVEKYVTLQFQIWELRSQSEWTLDISFLETLGIHVEPEREPLGELRTS